VAQHAAADGEEIAHHANDQDWFVSWHTSIREPDGQRHGAVGICLTGSDEVVLISTDGLRWEFPAGRPADAESGEETFVERSVKRRARACRERGCWATREVGAFADPRRVSFSFGQCGLRT
jgi:hypothetical protein